MAETALELRAILEAAERAVCRRRFCLSGAAPASSGRAAGAADSVPGIPISPTRSTTSASSASTSENPPRPKQCYRRAYRIASTALPADHPLVQTSGQNLRDFCEAIGKPVELSGAVPPGLEPFAPESGAPRPAPAPVAAPVVPAPAAPAPPPRPAPVARDPESPSPASPPLRLATETRAPEPPPRKPTEATRTASPVSRSPRHRVGRRRRSRWERCCLLHSERGGSDFASRRDQRRRPRRA